jgi:hypothetical protein
MSMLRQRQFSVIPQSKSWARSFGVINGWDCLNPYCNQDQQHIDKGVAGACYYDARRLGGMVGLATIARSISKAEVCE